MTRRASRIERTGHRVNAKGFTLTEILVTLLVISVGLLGVAGLHSWSLRNNHDALVRSHASALASEIADRMRANRQAALDGAYNLEMNDSPPVLTETEEEEGATLSLPRRDLIEWLGKLQTQLPNGDGSVQVAAAPSRLVTITISWGERDSSDPVTFSTQTEI